MACRTRHRRSDADFARLAEVASGRERVYQYLPSGFGWTRAVYDPALMWGLVTLSVASHGRGRCSVDFKLALEL